MECRKKEEEWEGGKGKWQEISFVLEIEHFMGV